MEIYHSLKPDIIKDFIYCYTVTNSFSKSITRMGSGMNHASEVYKSKRYLNLNIFFQNIHCMSGILVSSMFMQILMFINVQYKNRKTVCNYLCTRLADI